MVRNEINGTGYIIRPEHSTSTVRRYKRLCNKGRWFKRVGGGAPSSPPIANRVKRKSDFPVNQTVKKTRLDPGPETVLFLPHTPHSVLKGLVQSAENRINTSRVTQVKIVERNGKKLSELLCNKTPWRSEVCGNTQCVACCYAKGSCRKRNVLYRTVCVDCGVIGVSSVYLGGDPQGVG